jgi:hypothetical protein
MNILDPAFVYVPASKQHEHGVLARWREQRKNMGENSATTVPCREEAGIATEPVARPNIGDKVESQEERVARGTIDERWYLQLPPARPLNVKQLRRK